MIWIAVWAVSEGLMQLASQTANCQCALLILDPVSFIEIENYLCFTSLWPLLTSHPKVLLSWATLHHASSQLIDLDLQKSEFPTPTANTATTRQNSPPAACRTIANVHWPSLPKSHPCHKKKGQFLSPFWGPTTRQVLEENSPDFRDEE